MQSHFKAAGNTGIHAQMKRLKTLHNKARLKYNDLESNIILIPNEPFKVYKIVDADEVADRDFTIDQIVRIRDCSPKPGSRAEMARDLWMLSFYLLGMNAADMLQLKAGEVERVEYNRKKTMNHRKDKSFISIKLIDEARNIYGKYAGLLGERYKNEHAINNALSVGVQWIRKELGEGFEDLDFYSARHSAATIAANECGYPDSDVAKALNHSDGKYAVTRGYIRKSWNKIDEIQAAVVALLPAKLVDHSS